MSIFSDPRNYIDVENQPCQIGTGDCTALADGTCEECSKLTCRSCAVELPSGLFHCLYCDEDLKTVASKDQQQEKAA